MRHIVHGRCLVHLRNEIAQVLIIVILEWLVHHDRLALEVHLHDFVDGGRLPGERLRRSFPGLGHLRLLCFCAKLVAITEDVRRLRPKIHSALHGADALLGKSLAAHAVHDVLE